MDTVWHLVANLCIKLNFFLLPIGGYEGQYDVRYLPCKSCKHPIFYDSKPFPGAVFQVKINMIFRSGVGFLIQCISNFAQQCHLVDFWKKSPTNFNFIWIEWNSYNSWTPLRIFWSCISVFKLKCSLGGECLLKKRVLQHFKLFFFSLKNRHFNSIYLACSGAIAVN